MLDEWPSKTNEHPWPLRVGPHRILFQSVCIIITIFLQTPQIKSVDSANQRRNSRREKPIYAVFFYILFR
ncbi:hypothetical protein L1887_11885 [Cichorium endivia]|nr:hypothetical protein L1887_11885 [Cichorium endivia]